MRIIAYKTVDSIKHYDNRFENRFPNDYILEYTYTDLHEENSLKPQDGWLFMPEEQFNEHIKIVNVKSRIKQIKKAVQDERNAKLQAFFAQKQLEAQQKTLEEQALQTEFEAFKAWKKTQKD